MSGKVWRELNLFFAFLLGRRRSAWTHFDGKFAGRLIFGLFRFFHGRNIHFYAHWSCDLEPDGVMAFIFKDKENLENFLKADKLSWRENEEEKTRLYGEALGYPDFSIDDFIELAKLRKKDNSGRPKSGDRISFNLISYGYDVFIFRPKNFVKMKKWCEENNLPFDKATFRIRNSETGKWRSLSKDEIAQIVSSKNPEKLTSEIAQISKP
ncbi:MAG: hypothetical protein WAV68_00085 [Candidatus Nanogingivalis sp.]